MTRRRSPIYEYAAGLWRDMRAEFEDVLHAEYAKAEEGTGGAMLNHLGRREGIDAYSLLTGPWSRVEKYGSEELCSWFECHGRPSLEAFERSWFDTYIEGDPYPTAADVTADEAAELTGYVAELLGES
jgi:hypothetical protein